MAIVSLRRFVALGCLVVLAFAARPVRAQVSVTDAWVRGTVPGQQTSGVYMRLKSSTDTTLVGVASPVAKTVGLHQMTMDSGVMKMHATPELALPAGKVVELAPGGYHIMLEDLTQPLRVGESVPVTLSFRDKSGRTTPLEVRAEVRPLTSSGARSPSHH